MKRFSSLARALSLALLTSLLLSAPAFADDGDAVDFDDQGKDDFTVYRQSQGLWITESTEDGTQRIYQWGLPGDLPLGGQYTSNTKSDLAVYRPSNGVWYIASYDEDLEFSDRKAVQWGGFQGDIPVPCNYNGSSRQDLGIYRSGVWFARFAPSFEETFSAAWGARFDVPVPREVDDDNQCDLMVYRDGLWAILLSSSDYTKSATVSWGRSGDIPVAGDFDGDQLHDFSVYRSNANGTPSLWLIKTSKSQGLQTKTIPWGERNDVPLTSDLDGDNTDEIIVWRPSNGTWYALTSRSDYKEAIVKQFGLNGDVPIARRGAFNR